MRETIDESKHALCPVVEHYLSVIQPQPQRDDQGRFQLKIALKQLCDKVIIAAGSKKHRHATNRNLHAWTCEVLECSICEPLRREPEQEPQPQLPELEPPPQPVPEPEIRPPSPSPSPSPTHPPVRKPVSLCFCSQPEDVKHAVEEVLEAASRHSMLAVDTLEMMAEHTDFMKRTFKRMEALHSRSPVTSAPHAKKRVCKKKDPKDTGSDTF